MGARAGFAVLLLVLFARWGLAHVCYLYRMGLGGIGGGKGGQFPECIVCHSFDVRL